MLNLTLNPEILEHYLQKHLPISVPIFHQYQDTDYFTFSFNDAILGLGKGFGSTKTKLIYSRLLNLVKDYKEIQLLNTNSDNFICLILYSLAVMEHMNSNTSLEQIALERISTLIQIKAEMIDSTSNEVLVHFHSGSNKTAVSFKDNRLLTVFIDNEIETEYAKLFYEDHTEDIKSIIGYVKDSSTLYEVKRKINSSYGNLTSYIKTRTTMMLTDFINEYAKYIPSKRNSNTALSNNHIRFLFRVYEIIKWDFISGEESKSIKRFRQNYDTILKKMDIVRGI